MHNMNDTELNNKIAIILKNHFQFSIAYRILHLLLVIAISFSYGYILMIQFHYCFYAYLLL